MRTIGKGSIRYFPGSVLFGPQYMARQVYDWRLATHDDAATVEAPGFFDDLYSEMKVGEAIIATLDMGRSPQLREYGVISIDGRRVVVTAVV